MFSEVKKASIAKSLDMSVEELEWFVRRYQGYVNTHVVDGSVSKNVILNGLWLIEAVRKESLVERLRRRESIEFGSMRNEYIRRYGLEILGLKESGHGAQRISKHLKTAHNVMVSKSTIERFLKLNEVGLG